MECHDYYAEVAQGYHNDLEGIYLSDCIMKVKVFRSCLGRRLRFMYQNSTIECLFGVASLASCYYWASTRTSDIVSTCAEP